MGSKIPMPNANAERWESTAHMRSSVDGDEFISLWIVGRVFATSYSQSKHSEGDNPSIPVMSGYPVSALRGRPDLHYDFIRGKYNV